MDTRRMHERIESAILGYGDDAPVSPAIKMWAARYVDDVRDALDHVAALTAQLAEAQRERDELRALLREVVVCDCHYSSSGADRHHVNCGVSKVHRALKTTTPGESR